MDLCGVTMLTRDGTVVTELAAGPADTETGTPYTPQTRFQLCSVSKQFAAVAALLLAESGRLAAAVRTNWPPAATRTASPSRRSTWTPCPAPATSGRPRPT